MCLDLLIMDIQSAGQYITFHLIVRNLLSNILSVLIIPVKQIFERNSSEHSLTNSRNKAEHSLPLFKVFR